MKGAPGERREAVDPTEGLAAGMRPRFSTGGWPVRKPRPTHANPSRTDARRARTRGALSLAYFSLGTQREVGRAGQRTDRKLLISASGVRVTKQHRGVDGVHGGSRPTLWITQISGRGECAARIRRAHLHSLRCAWRRRRPCVAGKVCAGGVEMPTGRERGNDQRCPKKDARVEGHARQTGKHPKVRRPNRLRSCCGVPWACSRGRSAALFHGTSGKRSSAAQARMAMDGQSSGAWKG